MSDELINAKADLLSSLLLFTKTFYPLRTGRNFTISEPVARESHHIQICRKLVKVLNGDIKRLYIGIPPRYGKTELAIHFTAWALSRYPDSNFLYVSYAHTLATKQTQTIRDIINLSHYRKLFGVEVSDKSSAKDDFELIQNGSVYAAGAGGTITGRGAGIMGCDRFGGAVIIDDIHKPDEAQSDVIRNGVIDWYYNTMQSRLNNGNDTPIIVIGQRTHEDDLIGHLLKNGGWDTLIIPALDSANNALNPKMHTTEDLLEMRRFQPYVFAAQYQQDPQPAGGGLYKKDNFVLKQEEPEILETFITADTAETEKTYNDKTVFSFWGVYRIIQNEIKTDLFGLHWIDCVELSVEPKDLKGEFFAFYLDCMKHKVKPINVAIEKKSTGVTLVSVLKDMQGINPIAIERTKASGSKSDRFLEIQRYVASKLISLPANGKHTQMCVDHCSKITANNSHRYDDIADTLYDAVKLALIDKVITFKYSDLNKTNNIATSILNNFNKIQHCRGERTWQI